MFDFFDGKLYLCSAAIVKPCVLIRTILVVQKILFVVSCEVDIRQGVSIFH